jgi:16S rRNA (guanine966-N2)-methyltransferase
MSASKSGTRSAAPVRRAERARTLRIIGGTWRGRKLRFPARAAIRPTPDRVRETLFNWLGSGVPGAC